MKPKLWCRCPCSFSSKLLHISHMQFSQIADTNLLSVINANVHVSCLFLEGQTQFGVFSAVICALDILILRVVNISVQTENQLLLQLRVVSSCYNCYCKVSYRQSCIFCQLCLHAGFHFCSFRCCKTAMSTAVCYEHLFCFESEISGLWSICQCQPLALEKTQLMKRQAPRFSQDEGMRLNLPQLIWHPPFVSTPVLHPHSRLQSLQMGSIIFLSPDI